MATQPSRSSSLPWVWAIETLSRFDKVDASILIELVKRTPDISNCLGKNAREMVSLRILETLFAQRSGISGAAVSSSKRNFDPSECCEDVLRCILNETSASNLKMAGPEMSRWDVDTFILNKKNRLPKCALQLLEEGIVEGRHPVLASLKERSGLTIIDESEIGVRVDAANSRGVTQVGGRHDDDKTIARGGKSSSFNAADVDDHSQQHLPIRNLLPAKRVRNSSPARDVQGTLDENQFSTDDGNAPHLDVAKKLKQDAPRAKQATGQQSIILLGYEKAVSEENVLHTGRVRPATLIKTHTGGLAEWTSPDGDHGKDAAMQNNQQQHGVSMSLLGNSQGQNISAAEGKNKNEVVASLQISDGPQNAHKRNGANGYSGNNLQQNDPIVTPYDGAKDDMDSQEMSSDSDGCHEERINITARKHSFLSSQQTCSQDSFATAYCSELNLCVKCNTGGKLLVCTANACPIVVHESCLGSRASFDGSGKFYCPFCAYSQAISEYLEVKIKASLSRKNLAAFISLDVEHRPKRFSMRPLVSRKNQVRQNEDLHEIGDLDKGVIGSNDDLHGSNTENKQHLVSAVLSDDDNPSSKEKMAAATKETHCDSTENECEVKKMDQKSHPASDLGARQVAAETVPRVCDISRKEVETANRNGTPPEIEQHQGIRCQLAIDLPIECVRPLNTDAEGTSEGENDRRFSSNYFRGSRKLETQYTYPAIPQLRRQKVPWTKKEEVKLTEGVQRFVSVHDSKIPWTKILEFGSDVFAKGRTTIELKDKWRNLNKGSPKLK